MEFARIKMRRRLSSNHAGAAEMTVYLLIDYRLIIESIRRQRGSKNH